MGEWPGCTAGRRIELLASSHATGEEGGEGGHSGEIRSSLVVCGAAEAQEISLGWGGSSDNAFQSDWLTE